VGRSGSGKSTLADLVLGIHEPTTGTLLVAGVPLRGSAVRAWWNRVGIVPQHVFLANASVAENIAFGLPTERIDLDAVRRAAGAAQIEEFVRALPQGFDTVVGERGVKLSGGQRQRIGIARALYGDPEVLVFDEATNALDGLTEDALMQELRALQGARTLIVIAHRLRTVEACDRIVMLERGRIVADGAYAQLLESSPEFRRFVGMREPEAG
jgi:ATP-binding cassette, subfamily B, bacterial PglK